MSHPNRTPFRHAFALLTEYSPTDAILPERLRRAAQHFRLHASGGNSALDHALDTDAEKNHEDATTQVLFDILVAEICSAFFPFDEAPDELEAFAARLDEFTLNMLENQWTASA